MSLQPRYIRVRLYERCGESSVCFLHDPASISACQSRAVLIFEGMCLHLISSDTHVHRYVTNETLADALI